MKNGLLTRHGRLRSLAKWSALAVCATLISAAPAAAQGAPQTVTLDGQTVTLPNQGDLPKVQLRENLAVDCAPGTIRVGTKVEPSGEPKTMTFTATAPEVILAVSIKSGESNTLTVTFSADNRTATVTNTQAISNYVVVYCQPQNNPPPVCVLTNGGAANAAGKWYIQVTVQDPSGLQNIKIDELVNATVSISPDPYVGKTTPVVITATKTNPGAGSRLALTVTDTFGKSTFCDPDVPAHAAAKNKAGAKTRAAGKRRLTLHAGTVDFGSAVTLRGTTASRRAGQKVTIYSQACGFTSSVPIGTTRTKKGGTFTYAVAASINTKFVAKVGGKTSRAASLRVKPKLTLTALGVNRFRAAANTTNGHFLESRAVVLERRVGRSWQVVTQEALKRASSPLELTLTSASDFSVAAPIARGSELRLSMSSHEATCYTRTVSNTIKAR